jgi:hypothetical protein
MPNATVRELTDKLENGVKELFESDKYREYLQTMSRFHQYSTRNTILIHLQAPEARYVAGYTKWKNDFNRQVKKGEHGIKIYAPIARRNPDIEAPKLDPVTKQPILDERGQPVMERLSPTSNLGIHFKMVTVFSEQQTFGDPLPELAETLTGDVERYELFMDALRAVSPLPIVFEPMSDKDGYCEFGAKIAIRDDMSQIQTVSAVIHEITHEITHAKLHDRALLAENGEQPPDRRVEELTAEGVSYVVNYHFGVDTGANSFGYAAAWSKDKELKELNASLDVIRKTAASLIDAIDENYHALAKERGMDLTVVTDELVAEQNYNMLDGIINNEPPKNEETAEPQYSAPDKETPEATGTPRGEDKPAMEYSELQKKGFEIAKNYENLPLQERLNIIAQTFGYKSANIETHPCTGKWRGTSDISINLSNGQAALFIGNERTPEAKKASTISKCVNNALAKYNPQIVAEAKQRAAIALMERERADNAVAAELGLKPYTLLNVELNDGSNSKTGGYLGWYYVTAAVDGKIFGLCESNLNSDIARGEFNNHSKYFVAGGLRNTEPDFVFNNVGHASESASYKMELTADVLERAQKALARRERFNGALEGMKNVENNKQTLENKLYEKFAELFPDFLKQKYSYLRLESGGFEPLSLEWTFGDRLSVMQTYVQEGDLMYDPMIEFAVNSSDKTMTAVRFQQSMPPLYQYPDADGEWHSVDGNGNDTPMKNLQTEINGFAAQWFNNIEQQGFMPVRGTLWNEGEIEDLDVRVTFDKEGKPILPDSETPVTLDMSLPDPTVSVAEMRAYGYTADEMLPMSCGRALELFDAGHCIYLLYPDNTEAMAFDRDEIRLFDDICGIERNDWENSPVYKAQLKIAENSENSREADLLHNEPGMFGIYQIHYGTPESRSNRFAPMKELEAFGLTPNRADYELVYTAPLTIRDTQTNLHRIFGVFQHDSPECPQNFTARSVSVSDVIVLQWRGEVSSHFVDGVGFVELPSFTGNEREQSTLSQIDTTRPSVAEPVKGEQPKAEKQKAVPTLLGQLAEAKQLVSRVGQSPAKQNERNEREV